MLDDPIKAIRQMAEYNLRSSDFPTSDVVDRGYLTWLCSDDHLFRWMCGDKFTDQIARTNLRGAALEGMLDLTVFNPPDKCEFLDREKSALLHSHDAALLIEFLYRKYRPFVIKAFAAAIATCREIEGRGDSVIPAMQVEMSMEELTSRLKLHLGDSVFDAIQARGRELAAMEKSGGVLPYYLDGAATPPIKEAPPPNSRTAVDLPTPEWIRGDEGLTDTQVEAYAAVTFYKTKSAAAKKLGIHRKTLEERLQRGKARADNARAKRRSNT